MPDLPIGYILLFLLVAAFLYYRFLRGRRRKGLHGRDLWRHKVQERRRARLEGAQTWEERRCRQEMFQPQWKIAERFLTSSKGDSSRAEPPPEPGEAREEQRAGRPEEIAPERLHEKPAGEQAEKRDVQRREKQRAGPEERDPRS